ncbi:MAG TPA: hypothetical protein VN843_02380 [Anaerolineales bacterium]|nr:hypothetical protein [Anaerolineales bacterium]
MNANKLYLTLSGLVMLMTIAACVIPGQTTQPAPIANPNTVETSIAGTAQVSIQETLVPIKTLVPTEAFTPTSIISSYGTSLSKREDDSTLFIDHTAKVQIIFPSNWMAIRVGEPEYYRVWEKEGTQNPALFKAISAIQNLDLNSFRITAFDTHPEHILYENLPKINVVFLADDPRTLQQIETDERSRRPALADYKYLPSEILRTASGLETLMIQNQWSAATPANQLYTGHYRGYIFKAPGGTVAIDLFIPLEMKESLEAEHNQIVDSVIMLNP